MASETVRVVIFVTIVGGIYCAAAAMLLGAIMRRTLRLPPPGKTLKRCRLVTWLYVNRGIGMEGKLSPRVRFCARPEVTVIEISPPPWSINTWCFGLRRLDAAFDLLDRGGSTPLSIFWTPTQPANGAPATRAGLPVFLRIRHGAQTNQPPSQNPKRCQATAVQKFKRQPKDSNRLLLTLC
jgi:hypothetical protein